jgi:hypothetical protein
MGTYGPGHFDDDGAADLRAGVLGRLMADIETDLGDGMEVEDTWLQMGRVALLLGILQTCGGMPPESETVSRWRSRILEVYDDEIDELGATEALKRHRRVLMEETFQELEALSRDRHA